MRSSDLTYVALALLAFAVASGLFFYLGVTYGTGTIGSYQVAKVVVPLDSEADDLREELKGLLAEKRQLVAELEDLTSERSTLTAESDAVREERDELIALLAGTEKKLAAQSEIPAVPLLASTTDSLDTPVLETAAGPESDIGHDSPPQIAGLPNDIASNEPALIEDQVIYPAGGDKPTLGLQAPAKPLRDSDITAGLEAGLEAFKTGDYRQAYDTWLPLAEAGVRRAQFYVGGLFHDGRGVEADLVRAHYWLSLSDHAGYPLARPLLSDVEAEMTPQQRATARSLLAGQQSAGTPPNVEYQ